MRLQWPLNFPCISIRHCIGHPVSLHSTAKAAAPADTSSSPVLSTYHHLLPPSPLSQSRETKIFHFGGSFWYMQQQSMLQTSLFVHAFVLFITLNDIPLVSPRFTPSLMQNLLKHILRNEPASIYKLERQKLGLSQLK